MDTFNRSHFAINISADIENSREFAEQLNNSVFIIDKTSKVSTLSQVRERVLNELGMPQNTSFEDVSVMYLNDFVLNFNNDFVNTETYLAIISITL